MRAQRNLQVDQFRGVNVSTPTELLSGEYFPLDQNGDRRPEYAWRVRRGSSRLNDEAGAGIQFAGSAGNLTRRMVQFERDDDTLFVVAIGGIQSWTPGGTDDVMAVEAGEPE